MDATQFGNKDPAPLHICSVSLLEEKCLLFNFYLRFRCELGTLGANISVYLAYFSCG